MSDLAALVIDEHLDAAGLQACRIDDVSVLAALAPGAPGAAAAAVLAGHRGLQAAIPGLLTLAEDDDLAARAATWALGRLDAEAALITAANGGRLDLREHAYRALAAIAARGQASAGLATAMHARLEDELGRAKSGKTGLCEHVTRVLAVLGDPSADALIQRVVIEDSLTDRYELQRQRKQLADQGRDREAAEELSADWPVALADALHEAPAAAPEPVADHAAPAPEAGPEAGSAEDLDGEAAAAAEAEAAAAAAAIDWPAFAASPQAAALAAPVRQLISQLGPMLEQLAARAIGVPLATVEAQELVALLLQVLPQAVPPQYVQAALSPHAINGLAALAAWLHASSGEAQGLVDGVKLVRRELQASIRAQGILGGPDYSDPNEVSA